MSQQTHELKVNDAYWKHLVSGAKNFEVRRDDRGFQRGEVLRLKRHDPLHRCYLRTNPNSYEIEHVGDQSELADTLHKRITFILTGGQFGIEPGYVVMALEDA